MKILRDKFEKDMNKPAIVKQAYGSNFDVDYTVWLERLIHDEYVDVRNEWLKGCDCKEPNLMPTHECLSCGKIKHEKLS